MRHTDILLKHDAPSETARTKKEALALRQELDQMMAQAHALQELSNSAGWALFVDACKSDELTILGLIERAQDPISMAKLAGSLLTAKSFQTFAQDRAQDLLTAIESAKSEQE